MGADEQNGVQGMHSAENRRATLVSFSRDSLHGVCHEMLCSGFRLFLRLVGSEGLGPVSYSPAIRQDQPVGQLAGADNLERSKDRLAPSQRDMGRIGEHQLSVAHHPRDPEALYLHQIGNKAQQLCVFDDDALRLHNGRPNYRTAQSPAHETAGLAAAIGRGGRERRWGEMGG